MRMMLAEPRSPFFSREAFVKERYDLRYIELHVFEV